MRQSISSELANVENHALVAEIRVTELIRPFRFQDASGIENGNLVSFEARAEVITAIKGVRRASILRLILPGGSCDVPFQIGFRGFVASDVIRPNGESS